MSQHFRTIADYTTPLGLPPQHPHLAYVDFKQLPPFRYRPGIFGFYAIILKEHLGCGALQYGLGSYDYQAGTVLCVGPGQLFGPKDDGQLHQGIGKALCIHPTLLEGTSLAAAFASASFFAYTSREALHLADGERASFLAQFEAIRGELETPQDAHSHALLLAHLDLLLHLLARFYERQFTSRQPDNRALLARLETYLASALPAAPDAPVAELPTVAACAKALFLSPNYFGDLVRKETGASAQAFISHAILNRACDFLRHTEASIAQIGLTLGFSYPHHFTRFFRHHTGLTPRAYRASQSIGP